MGWLWVGPMPRELEDGFYITLLHVVITSILGMDVKSRIGLFMLDRRSIQCSRWRFHSKLGSTASKQVGHL